MHNADTVSSTQPLTDRIALVTGSSRGLGSVFAHGLGRAGAHVVLNGRDERRLRAAADKLTAAGIATTTARFDVGDETGVNEAVEQISRDVGPIDILVNSAGMQQRAPLHEFSVADWDRVIHTNLTSAFIVSKAVVPQMIDRGGGKIVNICSLQAELGRSTIAPYAASKGGLKMLTRAMCVEWARYNIQVNAIGPGYFATEMTQALRDDAEFDAWLRARTPAGRWGDPEELVPVLLLLCSRATSFVNGQIIYVDGGITAAI